MPTAPRTLDVAAVVKTRLEYCRALRALSVRQMELIESEDDAAILQVLSQKQQLLEEFSRAPQQTQFRQQWRASRDALTPDLRSDCERMLAECEAVLDDVLQREQAGADRLAARRDNSQQQLQMITHGAQAHGAYRDCLAPATHRFLDVNQ
jgi:hypothetical protein